MSQGGSPFDFEALLRHMVKRQASDLFITTGVAPAFKLSGRLESLSNQALSQEQVRRIVSGVMTPRAREEFEATQDANFALNLPDVGRFRINVFQQQNNVGMVVRRIHTRIPSTDELGLPAVLKILAMTRRGLILFVGATGTGKSTSLAAVVGYRNHHTSGHIVTIEDPIEYVHAHAGCIVTQREVGIDTKNYETGLKNALRQAPDVILVGEIRSREVMEHALAFAETGHLCLSTMHASNAVQALERIQSFFPEDRRSQLLLDLSMNLKAVVAQRLVMRTDGRGRCPAVEVLVNTPRASDLIHTADFAGLKELMKRSESQGMKTFDQAMYDLFRTGKITEEEAISQSDSENDVRLLIKLGKSPNSARIPPSSLDGVEVEKPEDNTGMLI